MKRKPFLLFFTYLVVLTLGYLVGRSHTPETTQTGFDRSLASLQSQATQARPPSKELVPPRSPTKDSVAAGLNIANPITRRSALQQILNTITSYEDAYACYQALQAEEQRGRRFPEFRNALLERAGAVAGVKFIDLLKPKDVNAKPDSGLTSVARGWASINPVEAVTWLNQAEGSFRFFLAKSILEGASTVNPEYAKKTFANFPPEQQVAALDVMLDLHTGTNGLSGIDRWYSDYAASVSAKGLPERIANDMTQRAFDAVATRIVSGDRRQAGEWLLEQWRQPVNSTPLLTKEPEYLSRFVNSWADEDIDSLGEWLAVNRTSPAYDRLTAGFARRAATLDPQASRAWADTISQPDLYSEVLKEIDFQAAFVQMGIRSPLRLPDSAGSRSPAATNVK